MEGSEKSNDGWAQGAVFDKIDLDEEGFPTSVVVGERDRAYVLHGRVMEGILGNSERESFMIEEAEMQIINPHLLML